MRKKMFLNLENQIYNFYAPQSKRTSIRLANSVTDTMNISTQGMIVDSMGNYEMMKFGIIRKNVRQLNDYENKNKSQFEK